jgi:hypothetical protein
VDTNEEIRFFDGTYYEYVPEGEYRARCIDYSEPIPYHGTRKLFLNFELLTQPWTGKRLFMPFNVGFNNRVRPGSKYFKAWCLANGDRLPSRNALMSARIFKGKKFLIVTRTVIPKRAGEDMSFDFHYSVVDSLKAMESPDKEDDPFD